jgi:Glyoxalase-like domain
MSEQAPAIAGIAALAVDCHRPGRGDRPGARARRDRADDVYDQGVWQVLRDPEGNEFCLLRPRT